MAETTLYQRHLRRIRELEAALREAEEDVATIRQGANLGTMCLELREHRRKLIDVTLALMNFMERESPETCTQRVEWIKAAALVKAMWQYDAGVRERIEGQREGTENGR